MTEKQKASELTMKFYSPERNVWRKDAKGYAKILVHEIIKLIDFNWNENQNLAIQHNYWEQVQIEIENL